MVEICYNCGIQLTDETKTSEHIPPQNLYVGLLPEYKQNLLTVTACYNCNNKFSAIDNEIRDIIGISNDSLINNQTITAKAVRGIFRQKKLERLNFNSKGQIDSVTFEVQKGIQFHIKNFKGLFFKEYNSIVPENYAIKIITDGINDNSKTLNLAFIFHNFLRHDNPDWKFSGHVDIFKYLISGFITDSNNNLIKTSDIQNSLGFAALLVYHNLIGVVIFCGRTDFIEHCKK